MKCRILLLLALVSGGCTQDDVSFVVSQFRALELPDCNIDPMGELGRSRGLLDLDFGRPYTAFPVVLNTTAPPMGAPGLQTPEMNTIYLTAFEIEIVVNEADTAATAALANVPLKFVQPSAGGRVTGNGGLVATAVDVITADMARALAATVPVSGQRGVPPLQARITPIGEKNGLRTVGSTISYPIDLCNGCLGALTARTCPAEGYARESVILSCTPGQDEFVTCCTDAATGILLCGKAVPLKM
jgi:hypothetical protein